MKKYNIPLKPDNYYHIYNCAVNNNNLFLNENNYIFFLKKYANTFRPLQILLHIV